MSERLDELRHALTEPIGPHLDDEQLAEIAAAEVAGEDVDAIYDGEMAHLACCPDCAIEYGELVALSATAVAAMAAAAQSMTPQQVFSAVLQQELAEPAVADVPEVVAALPLLFAQPPAIPEEFDAVLATTAWLQKSQAVVAAARHHLAALAAYLISTAAATWGQALAVQTAVTPQGHQLQLQPTAVSAMPLLSSVETGTEWHLLSRRVGYPVSWHVSARAVYETTTACTLQVQADRPGLADASGRMITIVYGERRVTAVTDVNGIATFPPIPIAALPTLLIAIDTQTEESAP
jgi:hypothetical protein